MNNPYDDTTMIMVKQKRSLKREIDATHTLYTHNSISGSYDRLGMIKQLKKAITASNVDSPMSQKRLKALLATIMDSSCRLKSPTQQP